jgi:hypothetical protein
MELAIAERIRRALARKAVAEEQAREQVLDEQALAAALADRNRLTRDLDEAKTVFKQLQAAQAVDERTFRQAEQDWLFHEARYKRGLPILTGEVNRIEAELRRINDLLVSAGYVLPVEPEAKQIPIAPPVVEQADKKLPPERGVKIVRSEPPPDRWDARLK